MRDGLDVALVALSLNALDAAALRHWLARIVLAARAPAWAGGALLPVALSVVVAAIAVKSEFAASGTRPVPSSFRCRLPDTLSNCTEPCDEPRL